MSRNLRDFTKAIYGFDAVVRRPPSTAWSDATPAERFLAFAGRDPRP